MSYQSENQLEQELIKQLSTLGFEYVTIKDVTALEANLRTQLGKFNNITFSDSEFAQIQNHIQKGNSFDKAKILRDRLGITLDNGEIKHISFFNLDKWCMNEYQVTKQVSQEGDYKNRYDVTLLINGLPLVQIELKKRGLEIKEAFNQVLRYQKHSFAGSLYDFVQIFVISNGVNTKYFANNSKQTFGQTFFWTDINNNKITNLDKFAEVFLDKCAVSEMIAEYIILLESAKIPMILRPYQYNAVRAIEKRVKESNKNGYIWHTTGSGKTLTSFKASRILTRMEEVSKVLFVVDRKDLDIQTTKEFNSFSNGSVDGTTNTSQLVKKLSSISPNDKLIVTTIQKLDKAIAKESHFNRFKHLADQKVVIIFDECHRSQFGHTHKRIKNFFKKAQLFGFTGTPIFAENNVDNLTTKDVFEECLHKYIITDAISDNSVLGFAIEYIGKYSKKEADTKESNTLELDIDMDINVDIENDQMVKGIDTKEVLESHDRLNKIADYVLNDWKIKTKQGRFNALFAVSNVEVLKKYYNLLAKKKPKDFKLATIFTYQANEEQSSDTLDVDNLDMEGQNINQSSREFLEKCIKDYNQNFETNFSTENFYGYYKDLQKRIKNKEVDLVLVVNIFLTGFDSPRLNTLFVDKTLRYHGLIQAYSRTNRLLDANKPHGNIVCFRNLKEETDKALALFGNANAKEIVFKEPYEKQKVKFEEKYIELKNILPEANSIDSIQSETKRADFVKIFRDLLRMRASLETFANFSFKDLGLVEQDFLDYQSKYLDLNERRKNNSTDKESILDQIDFEIELTVRDVINFDYIFKLIGNINDIKSEAGKEKKIKEILQILDTNAKFRKKKHLIQKFIEQNLPSITNSEDLEEGFYQFQSIEKEKALQRIVKDENIAIDSLKKIINEYSYTQKEPRNQQIIDLLPFAPKLSENNIIAKRIKDAINSIIDIFEW